MLILIQFYSMLRSRRYVCFECSDTRQWHTGRSWLATKECILGVKITTGQEKPITGIALANKFRWSERQQHILRRTTLCFSKCLPWFTLKRSVFGPAPDLLWKMVTRRMRRSQAALDFDVFRVHMSITARLLFFRTWYTVKVLIIAYNLFFSSWTDLFNDVSQLHDSPPRAIFRDTDAGFSTTKQRQPAPSLGLYASIG